MERSKEEMRLYQRERRARLAREQAARPALATVQPFGGEQPESSATDAVREQLQLLAPSVRRREPALAAALFAAARILDDPSCTPQHPAAIRELRSTLAELAVIAAKSGEKPVSSLSQMRERRAR